MNSTGPSCYLAAANWSRSGTPATLLGQAAEARARQTGMAARDQGPDARRGRPRSPWKLLARIAIMHALHGKPEPPIGNLNDAPPAPKWKARCMAVISGASTDFTTLAPI